MECLNNIIGISKTPCDCLEIDTTTSLSGLYLDDTTMQRIPLSASVWDCSDPGINELLLRLRADAITETKDLLYTQMQQSLTPIYRDTILDFPKKKGFSGYLQSKPYHYVSIAPCQMRGLYLNLNNVELGAGTAFKIVGEDGVTYFDDNVEDFIPMKLLMNQIYWVVYQPTDNVKNVKISCCGDNPEYKKYMTILGGSSNTDTNLKVGCDNYSQDIRLRGHISCDPFAGLCDIDYENNNWGRVFATTVLLVSRKNFLSWIMNSGLITNYLTVQGDNLQGLMDYYMNEISDRIKFMPTRMDFTDCFVCGGMVKGSIII